jgi:hypothetical protein
MVKEIGNKNGMAVLERGTVFAENKVEFRKNNDQQPIIVNLAKLL